MSMMDDLELARQLQEQFNQEASAEMAPFLPLEYRSPQKRPPDNKLSVVSDEWETIDPTPDLHALFLEFNQQFFWGRLVSCEVRWSPRMTQCAGICRYSPRERFCTIGISIPLLKLRPRKDLVETLLHEMIHAYLFVTDNNKDHDGHGPEFHKHMYRINQATGAKISVYHTFHDEVALYKQHWWRCGGPCTRRPPFYGFVKRAMNRAPGPTDRWWAEHSNSCGGSFTKVKEPDGFGEKKKKKGKMAAASTTKMGQAGRGQPDIRSLLTPPTAGPSRAAANGGKSTAAAVSKKVPPPPPINNRGGNIFGFGGTSYGSPGGGGLRTAPKTGTIVVKPGARQPPRDNSSPGTVVTASATGSIDRPAGLPGISAGRITSEGGSQLGGSSQTGPATAGLSAREAARQRWTSSIPPPATTTCEPGSSNTTSGRQPPLKSVASVSGPSSAAEEPKEAACPVCGTLMAMAAINSHLDQCLEQERDRSPMVDMEEEGKKTGVESGSDDGDDEPLAKRRGVDDSTEQDDLDLLAALAEDWEPEAGAEFTCPICLTLVPHSSMTEHLAHCLP